MAVHRCRLPSLGDEGADVFDLALDRIRGGVAAVAPAPTIVVEHSETFRQLLGGRAHQGPVAHRPAHQDDRRSFTQPVESDCGAIPRSYLFHRPSFSLVRRALSWLITAPPRCFRTDCAQAGR